ncbi:MAG: YkgJ family cysteine cluster protein [Thermodesulfobacteriota bacterium]
MSETKAQPLRPPFECQRCGQCCHGRGGIFLRPAQVPAAAAELGLEPPEFLADFCRQEDGLYEVLVDAQGVCRLLGTQGCRIHQAKPDICRRWPYFDNILARRTAFEDARQGCPGIDPEISYEQFVAHARSLGYVE